MTLTKTIRANLKRGLSTLALGLAILALSACGGGKKISTKDNSADYRSAQALPPLKKPSRVVVTAAQVPIAAPETSPIETPAPQVSAVGTTAEDIIAVEPSVETPDTIAEPSIDATEVEEDIELPIAQNSVVNASVVSEKSGQARLEIASGFDQAWEYLSDSLQKSDVTIFSRNKGAGRFSIGCANIAAAPTVEKSGGWSFFNRGKQQNLEYCALQVEEKRGTTIVSVLNRAGEEVAGEYSNEVFNRILNN